MSNFSFSNSVFKRLVSQGRQKVLLCGKGLMQLLHIMPCKPSLNYGSIKSVLANNRLNHTADWSFDIQKIHLPPSPCFYVSAVQVFRKHCGKKEKLLVMRHIMEVGDAHVFLGFLTPVLTQLFFPKPPTTFLIGERRKYAGKKSHLNRGSNSTTRS